MCVWWLAGGRRGGGGGGAGVGGGYPHNFFLVSLTAYDSLEAPQFSHFSMKTYIVDTH